MRYIIVYELTLETSFTRTTRILDLTWPETVDVIEMIRKEMIKDREFTDELRKYDHMARDSQDNEYNVGWLDDFIRTPHPQLVTDDISARDIKIARAYLYFMGLSGVASKLGGYEGSSGLYYPIPLNHYCEDGWRCLPPHFNNGNRDELTVLFLKDTAKQQQRAMSNAEFLVRLDAPKGTINPRRLEKRLKEGNRVAPGQLARGLHPDNYLCILPYLTEATHMYLCNLLRAEAQRGQLRLEGYEGSMNRTGLSTVTNWCTGLCLETEQEYVADSHESVHQPTEDQRRDDSKQDSQSSIPEVKLKKEAASTPNKDSCGEQADLQHGVVKQDDKSTLANDEASEQRPVRRRALDVLPADPMLQKMVHSIRQKYKHLLKGPVDRQPSKRKADITRHQIDADFEPTSVPREEEDDDYYETRKIKKKKTTHTPRHTPSNSPTSKRAHAVGQIVTPTGQKKGPGRPRKTQLPSGSADKMKREPLSAINANSVVVGVNRDQNTESGVPILTRQKIQGSPPGQAGIARTRQSSPSQVQQVWPALAKSQQLHGGTSPASFTPLAFPHPQITSGSQSQSQLGDQIP
jgi:hypothetical protein